jgi:serine/threonine protein kinase
MRFCRQAAGPWVAAVVDADPDAFTLWLAEYVDGPSLATAVESGGPFPPGPARALGRGLALAAVHGAGLAHRDLKPSNVLLDGGRPPLIDFGISRAIDGTRITNTGAIIGTPACLWHPHRGVRAKPPAPRPRARTHPPNYSRERPAMRRASASGTGRLAASGSPSEPEA